MGEAGGGIGTARNLRKHEEGEEEDVECVPSSNIVSRIFEDKGDNAESESGSHTWQAIHGNGSERELSSAFVPKIQFVLLCRRLRDATFYYLTTLKGN